MKLPLNKITISDRQRTDLGDIDGLAESLKENGQVTPILVKPGDNDTFILVAGHRRCAAAKLLNWSVIEGVDRVTIDNSIILVKDLTPLQLQILEYEENVRRKSLDWKESCLAVYRLHYLKQLEHGFAVAGGDNPNAWTERKMADFTGYKRSQVHYMLAIAKELQKEPKSAIHECEKYSDAFQFLVKRAEAEVNAEIERRRHQANPPLPGIESAPSPGAAQILSSTEEEPEETKRVVVYIHGVRKAFKDCVPGEDFMAGAATLVLGLNVDAASGPNIKLSLRENGLAILWNSEDVEGGLVRMPGALIWNHVRVLTPSKTWPYTINYTIGRVFALKEPTNTDKLLPAIVAAVPDELTNQLYDTTILPPGVVDYCVNPFALDGMAVECIGGVNPVHVAEIGRIPIWYEADEKRFEANVQALTEFYESQIPNVEVKLRA